jgi:mRNA interferase MazF
MEIKQYDIFWVDLVEIDGHEMRNRRPALVISPNEMNDLLQTVIIAPLTMQPHMFPTRIALQVKDATTWIALDQIMAIDRKRLLNFKGRLDAFTIAKVKSTLKEMFVD